MLKSVELCKVLVLIMCLCNFGISGEDIEEKNLQLEQDNIKLRMEVVRLKNESLYFRHENKEIKRNMAASTINVTDVVKQFDYVSQSIKALDQSIEPLKDYLKDILSLETNHIDTETGLITTESTKIMKILLPKAFLPQNCAEASNGKEGVYHMKFPHLDIEPFNVACDNDNWLIILRRMDGTVNFYRSWKEYQVGFGNANGEFFMGLERIHQLTTSATYELRIVLEDFDGVERFALYSHFEIGGESEEYALNSLGSYTGNAGDCFSSQLSMKFTSFDRDNDNWSGNVAEYYKAPWWHKVYSSCHLTGLYIFGYTSYDGIIYDCWRNNYSYKVAKIMIRKKN